MIASDRQKAPHPSSKEFSLFTALGSAEVNAKTEQTTVVETTYLRVFINDEETLEIDKLNMIFKVGGTDQMGNVRKALGMN